MASDYNQAGITVSHNFYILRSVAEDLIKGYNSDKNEHRHIACSKAELAEVVNGLSFMLASINAADTSRTVEMAE